jgi:transposase-like protein
MQMILPSIKSYTLIYVRANQLEVKTMPRQLSNATKGQIIGLYDGGKSMSAIAAILNISKSTVHLWISR